MINRKHYFKFIGTSDEPTTVKKYVMKMVKSIFTGNNSNNENNGIIENSSNDPVKPSKTHLRQEPAWTPGVIRVTRILGENCRRRKEIRENVNIGYDVIFDRIHPEQITIEDYAEIGDRCIISAHSRGSLPLRNKYPRSVQPVKIGMGVWMAPGCIVIQGVEILEKSVGGTGAVVTRSVPPNCLAAGVPAKVIKKLDE